MVSGPTANIGGDRPIMWYQTLFRDYVVLAVTLALAGVFIYAGADKVHDPLQFADSIAAFAVLPAVFIDLLALSLPPFEVACSLLLAVSPKIPELWGSALNGQERKEAP